MRAFLGLLMVSEVAAQTSQRDLVVLIDTSASMSTHYQELRDYLSVFFPQNFLKKGDTVHLIPFSDRARLDFSRRISGRNDIEIIIGRLLLMYPLDPYSDIDAALRFAERYIASLPKTRAKSVVFISDGDHNPSSPRVEGVDTQSVIAGTKARLQHVGVSFEFITIPAILAQSRPPAAPSSSPVQAPSPMSAPVGAPFASGPAAAGLAVGTGVPASGGSPVGAPLASYPAAAGLAVGSGIPTTEGLS
ncbi:MAG: VWA domain-containing protein, partial [Treponema sp.]|nr:VWA domain-containing protein [Treponema sp.]